MTYQLPFGMQRAKIEDENVASQQFINRTELLSGPVLIKFFVLLHSWPVKQVMEAIIEIKQCTVMENMF